MKTMMFTVLLFLQTNVFSQTEAKLMDHIPAETVASNSTNTGFIITLYRIADNQTTVYSMPPDFYNIDHKWQLVAGIYNVTFTPIGGATYTSTKFWVNSKDTYASGTGSVTINNVQLYEGGGNQVMISPN